MVRFTLPFFLLFTFQLVFSSSASGQTRLKGMISEGVSGEPVIGATALLVESGAHAISGLDGSFLFRDLEEGVYTLRVQFIGYDTWEEQVLISGATERTIVLRPTDYVLNEVVVAATRDDQSERSARLSEKSVMNVINVISGSEIEVSPDFTVANVMQRVSGVSIERNAAGDGQHAIVRGMDKRYNYTLVNGIKIPSSDPRNRYVPLDIFPSDLLDRLEVTKALTPNMEGDAIGGVMDMRMKNAPEQLTFNLHAGTGYSQMYFDQMARRPEAWSRTRSPHMVNGPTYQSRESDFSRAAINFQDFQPPVHQVYGMAAGNRFLRNKLGLLVAGSYQDTHRGNNSLFMTTFIDQEKNTPYYEIVQLRQFTIRQRRSGVHARADYRINSHHKIDLYLAAINLDDFEVRTRTDTILKIGRGQGPGTGRIILQERSRQRYQNIYNGTLQGQHQWHPRFKTDWSAVFSLAANNDPDMAEVGWLTAVTRNEKGTLVQDPVLYDTDYRRRWINNTDTDLAGYLNMTYNARILGLKTDWSAGGMYRFKDRESRYDEYLFRALPIIQEWSGDIYDASWELFNSIGTPTHPLNYNCEEEVTAAYGMFRVEQDRIQVMGGARFEATSFRWQSQAPQSTPGRTGSIDYADLLPSLHVRFTPNPRENYRATYFSSISRPSFLEVIPYEINEDDFRERGNPFLQRTTAHNLDLRYERYTNYLDKIMVGLFYKQINNPIETALLISGQSVFLQPNNFGTAQNMGLELDFTRYFRNIGIRMFYTYTLSEITTSKIVRFRDDNGNLTSRTENQTRPLQGQSKHISNVSLLYKSARTGWNGQLAMVYTGDRIISVSPYLDNDIWQRGFVQLDLSVEKRLGHGLTVYAKINNLLDTPLLADIRLPNTFNPQQAPYLDATSRTLVREDYYGQVYFMGLKYQLTRANR